MSVESVLADVLDDHVHHDVGLGHAAEQRGRDPGSVRHPRDGDLGLLLVVGDARDHHFLHGRVLLHHHRPGIVVEAGPDVHRHQVVLGVLDRARLQHLGAQAGQFQHLVVGDPIQLPRLRHDVGVRGVDAVHVGIDLAHVGLERRRHGHRRQIRAAPPQGRDLVLRAHALEARHDGDLPLGQGLADALGVDAHDPSLGVDVVGLDAHLAAGEAPRAVPEPVNGQRQQADADLLSGRQDHIQLALVGAVGHLLGQSDQPVRLPGHGRDHHHHVVARRPRLGHATRHVLDAIHDPRRRSRRTSGRSAPSHTSPSFPSVPRIPVRAPSARSSLPFPPAVAGCSPGAARRSAPAEPRSRPASPAGHPAARRAAAAPPSRPAPPARSTARSPRRPTRSARSRPPTAGIAARTTPSVVATPLPPRNRPTPGTDGRATAARATVATTAPKTLRPSAPGPPPARPFRCPPAA